MNYEFEREPGKEHGKGGREKRGEEENNIIVIIEREH